MFNPLIFYGAHLVIGLVLLRAWMQLVRVDYYNPVTKNFVAAFRPLIDTLGIVLPVVGRLNTAATVLALGLSFAYIAFVFPAGAPDQWAIGAVAFVISIILWMIFWVLLASVISSWVLSPDNPWSQLGRQLLAPIMLPIQKVIPSVGGLDFSPIVVFFGVQILRRLIPEKLFMLSGLIGV